MIEFIRNGTVAEIELTAPKFEDILNTIVYATPDQLRVVKRHESKSDSTT